MRAIDSIRQQIELVGLFFASIYSKNLVQMYYYRYLPYRECSRCECVPVDLVYYMYHR